ncbi:ABC transporter permease [Dethiosulfatarculus sandiegensis]|uniref:ABC transporter permease n=1 Tax=Dethiosulfatarculus sandiegensis TaxID=1429043 RepID=A0A0D2JJC9_9BACT|nr:ABC transporter permease [Dethiosulfatarculus sandiegensis]KIX15781.1 ABC transporter permease [Dethiosulfatarculus sandiegensis]
MLGYLIKRVLQSILVLLCVSIVVFAIMYLSGDPTEMLLPPEATQKQVEELRHHLGLDQPFFVQYKTFMASALQGDLGKSFVFNKPAIGLIVERIPATMELAVFAMVLAVIIGLPAGMYAAVKPDSWLAKAIMSGSLLGISLPVFWLGIILVLIFSVILGWLPSSGRGETEVIFGIRLGFVTWSGFKHLLLPALTIAVFQLALIVRLVRAGMLEVLLQDFVKFLRAKGLSAGKVVYIHALKNILIPVVTIIGLQLGNIIAFAVVTESIFAWPGMGKLVIESIHALDRPVVLAYLLIVSLLFVFLNFLVDVVYTFLDPRIRLK